MLSERSENAAYLAAKPGAGLVHLLPLIPTTLYLTGVILRDLVIVAGAVIYHVVVEQVTMEPSMVSKLNTFTQILLVLAVMFSRAVQELPFLWVDVLLYSVLATTILSGLGYVWTWSRRAMHRHTP